MSKERTDFFRFFAHKSQRHTGPGALRTVRNGPFLNILTSSLHETPPGTVLDGFQTRNGYPKREPIFPIFRAQVPMTHRAGRTRTARNGPFPNILTSSLRETPPGMVLDGFQMRNGYPKREPIFPIFRAQVPMTHRAGRTRTARNGPFPNILTSSLRETPPGMVLDGFQMRNGYPKREPIFPYFGHAVRTSDGPGPAVSEYFDVGPERKILGEASGRDFQ